MASGYPCRACSRALSRASRFSPQTVQPSLRAALRISSQPSRSLATSAPSPATVPQKTKPHNAKKRTPRSDESVMQGLAKQLREKAPDMKGTYAAYGATDLLFRECLKPGEYTIPQAHEKGGVIPTDDNGTHVGVGEGWWYETLGLTPTFQNWAQITFLHMYMLQVRLRMLPAEHTSAWVQHLTNHAFYAAEDRLVIWHRLNANSLRQKFLKDMFSQWRAVLVSYDEGLMKGDAVLAAAVWRNLLAEREDVDFQKLAQVVGYMRRDIRRLEQTPDEEIVTAQWKFTEDPGIEADAVARLSRSMTDKQP